MNNKIQEKLEIAINEIMNDPNIPQDLKDKFIKIREESKTTAYSLEKEWYESDGDSKLCYCGNPIDTSNSDCVTFNLCKEHQMDA
jgi:hypothetical protein